MNAAKWLSALWADDRARREARAYSGDCPACRRDWREHSDAEGCSEYRYEIDHAERGAPSTPCTQRGPRPS